MRPHPARASLALAAALATAACPAAPARAQPAASDGGGDGDPAESPELRALRLAEEALFRPPDVHPESPDAEAGTHPAFTSEAPTVAPPRGAWVEGEPGARWLENLALPDLPVRWDARVVEYLEYFRDDPRGRRLVAAWIDRERRFGPLIRETLREHGLPEDLLYVAMIESGFDPTARSHAGAVGLWQFVGRTAEGYGLRRDRWVDERMDPVASTRAAARFLSDLHERFGRWELALAAYNMGYGALLRAIRKYNTNDYWLLSHLEAGLPFETTLYVAKVVACAIVGHNPEEFGIAPDRAPVAGFEEVEVPPGTPLRLVARAARIDDDELAAANPGYLRNRTPPDGGPWRVRLPEASLEAFGRRWPRLARSRPATRTYELRLGESLADVARAHRITLRELLALNGLDGDERQPGMELLVPVVEPREPAPADERLVVPVPETVFHYPDRERRFYRVTRGDSCEDVARFFGVTVNDLARWNAIDPRAALQSGMMLQVFVPPDTDLTTVVAMTEDEVRTVVLGSEAFFDWHERQNGRERVRYVVRPGDTLIGIGRRFGLEPADIARINGQAGDDLIRAGETLILYRPADD